MTKKVQPPKELLKALVSLRDDVLHDARKYLDSWQGIGLNDYEPSASNLAHYLALRRYDLRSLQQNLSYWGLSSLGRTESHVMANLEAVISTLGTMSGKSAISRSTPELFFSGSERLRQRKRLIFGRDKRPRRVRIMVTMPSEAATNKTLVEALLKQGMNIARINCAHDNQVLWQQMIYNIRLASEATGLPCRVCMDLAGPKLRTAEVNLEHRCQLNDTFYLADKVKNLKKKPGVVLEIADVLNKLQVGHRVFFDDGLIGTVVEEVLNGLVKLRVVQVSPKGKRLRTDKGINVPDSILELNPLTDKDLKDLDFIVKHADMVAYSFVQDPDDIVMLQAELGQRSDVKPLLPLVLKIETHRAVQNLPTLIVQAASKQPTAVMIARGDLAIELGYERFAEMQEELLWLCEAAQVPVIWATQVLENLAKKGIPSRAEITDAAMGERAECVMLNKGPYILKALELLDNVLTRMQEHQSKKSAQLRALKSWVNP